jgi:Phage integrase, N-terminal SAM-like domain
MPCKSGISGAPPPVGTTLGQSTYCCHLATPSLCTSLRVATGRTQGACRDERPIRSWGLGSPLARRVRAQRAKRFKDEQAARAFDEALGEVRHTKQTFAGWWDGWLGHRKPYLEPNAWRAYEVDGRKRLVPAFGDVRLDKLSVEQVRTWMDDQAERVEAGDIAAKTINNTSARWSSV